MVTDQTAGRIQKEMFVQSYRGGVKLFVVLNFNRPWDSFKMHIQFTWRWSYKGAGKIIK